MNDAAYLEGRGEAIAGWRNGTVHPRLVVLTELFIRALLTKGGTQQGKAPAIIYIMTGHVRLGEF